MVSSVRAESPKSTARAGKLSVENAMVADYPAGFHIFTSPKIVEGHRFLAASEIVYNICGLKCVPTC
jgi:hypothetical protein